MQQLQVMVCFKKSIYCPLCCVFLGLQLVVAMNILGQDTHVEKFSKLIKSSMSFGVPQPWVRDNTGPAAINPQIK